MNPAFLLQAPLRDGGLFYTETNPSRFIVEPWNGASALIFIGIAWYWFRQIRGKLREQRFLAIALPILAIGGIGGTLYHAFRVSRVFLFMDFVPILLLCLMAGFYFFSRSTGRWWLALLIMVGIFFLQGLMWSSVRNNATGLPVQSAITLNYAMMGLMVLAPLGWWLVKTGFRHGRWIAAALLSFGLALFSRLADPWALLPMGTHFLWHVFGAAACHCMLAYVYWQNESPAPSLQAASA